MKTLNFSFFFFNDTATTEIYTLSLHDALPISISFLLKHLVPSVGTLSTASPLDKFLDRKSTRLNSSHSQISYAVFCLKKKKTIKTLPSFEFIKTYTWYGSIPNFTFLTKLHPIP